jgi:hypothetical protein
MARNPEGTAAAEDRRSTIDKLGNLWCVFMHDAPRCDSHALLFQDRLNGIIMAASYAVKGDSFVPDKPRAWLATRTGVIYDYDVAPDGQRVVALQEADRPGEGRFTARKRPAKPLYRQLKQQYAASGRRRKFFGQT